MLLVMLGRKEEARRLCVCVMVDTCMIVGDGSLTIGERLCGEKRK